MSIKGYKTFIANGLMVLAAIAAAFGILVPVDEQAAVLAGAVAVINIALRFYTSTPWGRASPAATGPLPRPNTE